MVSSNRIIWLCFAVSTTFLTSVTSLTCSSRFYCKTTEIKYMGMNELKKAYLNTTAISNHTVENITACQILCNREPKCFSLNINISIAQKYECQILEENMFSHADRVVVNSDFIHLFIETQCSKNPCKNNAMCKPSYVNDSYSCDCVRNNTYITTGRHCEKIISIFETADYFWTFDQFPEAVKSWQHPNLPNYQFTADAKTLRVPARTSLVATCDVGKICPSFDGPLPCINSLVECTNGSTYSIWVKLRKEHASCSILQGYSAWISTGIQLSLKQGKGYNFEVFGATGTAWGLSQFGKNVNPLKWNHIVVTFHPDIGICAYINGKRNACANSYWTKVLPVKNHLLRIGFHWDSGGRCLLYADDFAVWRSLLTEKDVRQLYEETKSGTQ